MIVLASLCVSVLLLAGPGPHPPPLAPVPADEIATAPGRVVAAAPTPSESAVWPLRPPDLARGFEPPTSTWGAGHRGVDLRGLPGQQVRAALGGTVDFVGTVAGRGVVVVSHGARRTTYEPVTAWVEPGDLVAADAVLGVLAPGPSHCEPASCLHWGLREGDAYLDPLSLFGPRQVRLLPVLEPALRRADAPAGTRFATGRW